LGADTDTVSRRLKRKNDENRPPPVIEGEDVPVVHSVASSTRSRADMNSKSAVTKGNSGDAFFAALISVQY
jgi:hypothetical protein